MRTKWAACLAVLAMSYAAAYGATPSFQGLGILPGGSVSNSLDLSADGRAVVGWSASSDGEQGFIWTAETGMVGLGRFGSYYYSRAYATS